MDSVQNDNFTKGKADNESGRIRKMSSHSIDVVRNFKDLFVAQLVHKRCVVRTSFTFQVMHVNSSIFTEEQVTINLPPVKAMVVSLPPRHAERTEIGRESQMLPRRECR